MGLKRDSVTVLSLNGATLLAGILVNILVAQKLGPEGKGILYLLFLAPQFVTSLGSLGLRSSSVFHIGRGFDRRAILRDVAILGTLLAVVYTGAGWLLRGVLAESALKGLEPRWVALSLLLIPVYLFWNYGEGPLQGARRFGLYAVIRGTSVLGKALLLAIGLLLLGQGIAWAVAVYLATAVIPAVWTLLAAARITGGEGRPGRWPLLRYGLQGHLGTMAQRANLRLDVFILNPYVGPAGVGVYSIASLLGELVWQIPEAVSTVLLPRIAASERAQADRLTRTVSRHTMLLTGLAALGIAATAPVVVRLAFGEDFAGAIPAVWCLLPGILALCMSKVLTKYLAGTGRPLLNSWASVFSLALNVPALILLIPPLGVVGAAIATSIAYVAQTAAVVFYFRRDTGAGLASFLVPTRDDLALYGRLARDAAAALRSRPGRSRRTSPPR